MFYIPDIVKAELVARGYYPTEEMKIKDGVKYFGCATKPEHGKVVWLGFDDKKMRYVELAS